MGSSLSGDRGSTSAGIQQTTSTGLAKALRLTAATPQAHKHDTGSGSSPSLVPVGGKRETGGKKRGRRTFRGKPEVSTWLAEGCASALSGFAGTTLSFGFLRKTCPDILESGSQPARPGFRGSARRCAMARLLEYQRNAGRALETSPVPI